MIGDKITKTLEVSQFVNVNEFRFFIAKGQCQLEQSQGRLRQFTDLRSDVVQFGLEFLFLCVGNGLAELQFDRGLLVQQTLNLGDNVFSFLASLQKSLRGWFFGFELFYVNAPFGHQLGRLLAKIAWGPQDGLDQLG